jgi:serine-type D-Ala-D-Ala carboxypeptidase (penicillin-binding protein 5/6)
MNSPLAGGTKRRRRTPRAVAVGALVLTVVAAAGTGWVALDSGGDGAGTPPTAAIVRPSPPPEPPASTVAPAIAPAAVLLEAPDAFEIGFRRPPRAGMVFDLRSGRVLWRRHPTAVHPIASLTKIMTALVVVDRTPRRARVRIPRRAVGYTGSGVGLPRAGRLAPIQGLLAGLLVVSGNDASIALAERVAGSERRFVRLMNRRSRALGMSCTRFVSPHGLEKGNRSCAADLAAMTRLAMRRGRIARLVRSRQVVVPFPIRNGKLYLNSTNPLLRSGYRGTIGLKTGYTKPAGHSLVAVVRRGGRRLGVVLLHSPNPARQAKRLLNRAFRPHP